MQGGTAKIRESWWCCDDYDEGGGKHLVDKKFIGELFIYIMKIFVICLQNQSFFLYLLFFFKYFFSFYLRQYHKLKCNVMLCCWPIILLPYMMRNPSRIINPKAVMIPMPKKNPAAPYNWQPWSPYNQLNKIKLKLKIKKK